MSRGDRKTTSSKSTDLFLGLGLLIMALAATLIVIYVRQESEPAAPVHVTPPLSWRLCDVFPLDPSLIESEADADLRSRGYRSIGEWSASQPFGEPIEGAPLEGGCGVFLIRAEGTSTIEGRIDGGTRTVNTCNARIFAAASCGESVTIAGLGEFRSRPYLMPSVGPLGDLPVEHLLAHAESEHLLAAHGFEATPHLLWPESSASLPPPATGCTFAVTVHLPTSNASAPPPPTHTPRLAADQFCAGTGPFPFGAEESVRAVDPYRTTGVPRTGLLSGSVLHRTTTSFPPLLGN